MVCLQSPEIQPDLGLDDGTGLRVASARFIAEDRFDWELFRGYDSIRILTYSASIQTIVRLLDDFEFASFECVFGCEATLHDVKGLLAFQRMAVSDTRAAIMGLKDERHAFILGRVREGLASFRVVRKSVAHAKLYLLENTTTGNRRVIIGSANLSERAFSGQQPETLVRFDDDDAVWKHYMRMYRNVRDSASDEIPLPDENIVEAEIDSLNVPALADEVNTLVFDTPTGEEPPVAMAAQVERIEKMTAAISPHIASVLPPHRAGKQRITPQVKRDIGRIRLVKSAEEADHRYFSINRGNRVASLSGEPFPLEWEADKVRLDARLMLDYFGNYEGAFEGDVSRLQRDYFTLWSWLYFSPLICDLRTHALIKDEDVVRYPSFAIVFGKSNCGKTSLVDTLMTSMFNKVNTVDKRSFTTKQLRALQQAYRRFPVVFDDIGRHAFTRHGRDIIKDELPPPVEEYPGFLLSMNAEPKAFPDEIVKRSMMIYTTTALPPHNEALRQSLHSRVQSVRSGLTGHLYRRYLADTLAQLLQNPLPADWLALSSGILNDILGEATDQPLPGWGEPLDWLSYADKRYDRVKIRLNDLLRPSAMLRRESEAPNGWMLDGDRIVVQEQRDAFGRRGFDWEDVPSTLIDEDASGGGRTVLHRASVQSFLDRPLRHPARWRFWGKSH